MTPPSDREKILCAMFESFCVAAIRNFGRNLRRAMKNWKKHDAGIVSFGFPISGTFSSTTTSTTQTVISGLPFTYKGNGLATGGGIAYGCTSSSPGFFGWCVSNGQSTITARNSTISGNIYGAGYVYSTPGFTYSVSGSITMRAV